MKILNLSKSAVQRLMNLYRTGLFETYNSYVTAGEKKKLSRKNYKEEKEILAHELSLNPTLSLKELSQKLAEKGYIKSVATVCKILKLMNYTRKIVTLVITDENSDINKQI